MRFGATLALTPPKDNSGSPRAISECLRATGHPAIKSANLERGIATAAATDSSSPTGGTMTISRAAGAMLAAFLICALATALQAQTLRVDKIDISDAGIYTGEVIKKTPDPTDPTGFLSTLGEVKLVERTTIVPAKLGVRFGMHWVFMGASKSGSADIRLVTRFPASGLRNSKTGEISFRSENTFSRKIGAANFYEYTLENDWEVVPGVWIFEFWHKDRKLAEQSFTLMKP
jgi:hypothetical protein